MKFICLDESGPFRNTQEKLLVAGLVFSCGDEKLSAEKERIIGFLRGACEGAGGVFPGDLHEKKDRANTDTVHAVREAVLAGLPDFFKNTPFGGAYRVFGVYNAGPGVSANNAGEAADGLITDGNGDIKYLRMVQTALRGLLSPGPSGILSGDDSLCLTLARRATPGGDNDHHLERLNSDGNLFRLTGPSAYLSMISSVFDGNGWTPPRVQLWVQSIEYERAEHRQQLKQAFLYLADLTCSVLRGKDFAGGIEGIRDRAEACFGPDRHLIRAYSDTDTLFFRAAERAGAGDLYGCYDTLFDIPSDAPDAGYYTKVWLPRLEQQITAMLNEGDGSRTLPYLQDYAARLESYVHSPRGTDSDRSRYLLEKLERLIQGRAFARQFDFLLNRCRLTLANHRGDGASAEAAYRRCMNSAGYASADALIDLRNARSVSLIDADRIGEAAENARQTVSYAELLWDMRAEATEPGDEPNAGDGAPVRLHYGRALSQLGQCLAFQGEHAEAQERFRQALEAFGNSEEIRGDRQRTLSYLLQSLIETGDREHYAQYAEAYFGAPPEAQAALLTADAAGNDDSDGYRFRLLVWLKAAERLEPLTPEQLRPVLRELNRKGVFDAQGSPHPQELICKYGALLATRAGLNKIRDKCTEHIRRLLTDPDNIISGICLQALREIAGEPTPENLPRVFSYMYS